MKNGFKLPEITEKVYRYAGERSAPFEVINDTLRWPLPKGEPQIREIESSGCTNAGTLNALESLELFKYKELSNYSERYQAVISGQDERGNDPLNVAESIRTSGVIPETMLAFTNAIKSFKEYLSPKPMTKNFLDEGRKWLEKYRFNHEYLFTPSDNYTIAKKQEVLLETLKRSPLCVSVRAWIPQGEFYVKNIGDADTHWAEIFFAEKNKFWAVYDSYPEGNEVLVQKHMKEFDLPREDALYVKKLAWNYDFAVGWGYYLHRYTQEELIARQKTFLDHIKNLLSIIETLLSVIKTSTPVQPAPVSAPAPKEKIGTIKDLADAIERYENANKMWNNPGGLRSSPFENGHITQGTTGKRMATFSSYAVGRKALEHQIRIVCDGTSKAYNKEAKKLGLSSCADMTIEQFLHVYAPSIENKTENYITYVEKYVGKRSLTMKQLIMKYGVLSSSYDPEKLSLTVKGLLLSLVPVILFISGATSWGQAINNENLSEIVDLIVQFTQNILGIASTAMVLWGALRKIFVAIGWVIPKQ